MGTNCKIVIGYTDHIGWWKSTKAYYRHYDGYSEAILPLLKKFTTSENGVDIPAMNEVAEFKSHKFEECNNPWDYGTTNYMYFIDESDRGNIKCTVLTEDIQFSRMFNIHNMMVEQVLNL